MLYLQSNYPNKTELEMSNKVMPIILKNKNIIITLIAISALCVVYLVINSLKNKNIVPDKLPPESPVPTPITIPTTSQSNLPSTEQPPSRLILTAQKPFEDIPETPPNPIEDRTESFDFSIFYKEDLQLDNGAASKIAVPLSDKEIALVFYGQSRSTGVIGAHNNFHRELPVCQKLASIPSHPNVLKVVAFRNKVEKYEHQDGSTQMLSIDPTIIVERCQSNVSQKLDPENTRNFYFFSPFDQNGFDTKATEIAEIKNANPLKHNNNTQLNKYVFQLSSALKHMHKYGIAHGDVQSKNVFIAYDDSIRLGDFDQGRFEGDSLEQFPNEHARNRLETMQDDVMALANVIMTMEVGQFLSPFSEEGHSMGIKNIDGTLKLEKKGFRRAATITTDEPNYHAFIDALIEDSGKRDLLKRMARFDRSNRPTMASILPEIAQLWPQKQVESMSAAAAAAP